MTLPSSELSGDAWDRIAEVVRASPDARWSVEVRGEAWTSASRAAGSACAALVARGVDASQLRALGRQSEPPSPIWRGMILEEGVDAGAALHARPAPPPPAPPPGAPAPPPPPPAPGP